jgi:hypothetical protein
LAIILTLTSPSLGTSTSISVTSSGFFASQATAAKHFITLPFVSLSFSISSDDTEFLK